MRDISEEILLEMVKANKSWLLDIHSGKLSQSWRHKRFHKGGKDELNLKYKVRMGYFTDDQDDLMIKALQEMFPESEVDVYYVLGVMLAEIRVKIYMDTFRCSYEEAEIRLGSKNSTALECEHLYIIANNAAYEAAHFKSHYQKPGPIRCPTPPPRGIRLVQDISDECLLQMANLI